MAEIAEITAYTCALIFTLGLALSLGSFWRELKFGTAPHVGYKPGFNEMLYLFVALLAVRIAVYIIAHAVSNPDYGFFTQLTGIWVKGDAPHYIGIAKFGYLTVGDARFHIVFFPLYPLAIKLFWFLFGDYYFSALFISNAASIGAGMLLYKLVSQLYGQKTAIRSIKYLMLFPAMLFYNAPYTEGLFLLLSVACFYFMENEKLLLAGILGMLAALTRSVGVLLFVPLFVHCVLRRAEKKKLTDFAWCLLVPLGLLIYFLINKAVTGDPFKFLDYQKNHWAQQIGNPINTIKMILGEIAKYGLSDKIVQAIWIPGIACIVGGVISLAVCCKKNSSAWSLYALCYVAVAVAPTWLISAPRYLGTLFPLAVALALAIKSKWADRAVTAFLTAGSLVYLYMFAVDMHIY